MGLSKNQKAHFLNCFACVAGQQVTIIITAIRWKIQLFNRELKSAKQNQPKTQYKIVSLSHETAGPSLPFRHTRLCIPGRIVVVPPPSAATRQRSAEATAHHAQLLALVTSSSLWLLSCTKGMARPQKQHGNAPFLTGCSKPFATSQLSFKVSQRFVATLSSGC